jgi:hypothetical protein
LARAAKITGLCCSHFLVETPMTVQPSPLYMNLLGETARISWDELQPFFARGALLWVAAELDLVAVAEALAQDDRVSVAKWLEDELLAAVAAPLAEDLLQRDPELWAVVVAPWVVIQERSGKPQLH